MVNRKEVVGSTLGEFAEMRHEQRSRGLFVRALIRGGHELPFNTGTRISRGDVLRVSGSQRDVERVARTRPIVACQRSASPLFRCRQFASDDLRCADRVAVEVGARSRLATA